MTDFHLSSSLTTASGTSGDCGNDGEQKMMSSSSTESTSLYLRQPDRLRSIPELLWHREAAGITRSSYHYERVSPHRKQFFGDLAPSADQLSSTVAWNVSRMQNMILVVGPGTPASLLMKDNRIQDFSSTTESEDGDDDEEDDDEEDEDEDGEYVDEDHDNEDDDDEEDDDDDLLEAEDEHDHPTLQHMDDSDDEEEKEPDEQEPLRPRRRRTQPFFVVNEPEQETETDLTQQEHQQQPLPWTRARNERYAPVPSMRHGGCINTATWLTCPWRLSTVSHQGPYGMASSSFSSNDESHMATVTSIQPVASSECPTQLLTSGDDRVVKFWDVSSSMGTANPLYGGTSTVCPFSAPIPRWSSDVARKRWKSYYFKRMTSATTTSPSPMQLSGSVIPLFTLATGHRANVFHAAPLDWQMGKVATCGADGYLRLSDIVSETNSIIVSPDDRPSGGMAAALMGYFNLHPNMCFSHVFLNANTGLLCSERGLKRFDIRLPPQEQPTQNLMGASGSTGRRLRSSSSMSPMCCKTCAVYSYSSLDGGSGDEESAYVFAGGPSATVSLFDLRMTGGDDSSSRVIERYRSKALNKDSQVSVSGLDISKDKRELLVSYENDQIYTFPIFPHVSSAAGPSVEDIQTSCEGDNEDKVVTELCSFGAHLNRYTFLKNAKYAGPQDDYICTGSDSGRAWIYERATGSVVSLLNADRSTCNGVVPHPSLPIFITYGIDSTAKLWRATLPVDSNVDDSAVGRAKCFHQRQYEMSPAARNWQAVQDFLDSAVGIGVGNLVSVFPDQIPNSKEMVHRGRVGRAFLLTSDTGNSQIGNDLHNLPQLLKQNAFVCLRALCDDADDEPIRSGFAQLKRRLSSIRLRHQAAANGLRWNRSIPWLFAPKRHICATKAESSPNTCQMVTSSSSVSTQTGYCDLVDFVPDNPSDWIPYDPHMTCEPLPCGTPFNVNDYEGVCDRYSIPRGCIAYSCESPESASWKRAPSQESETIAAVSDDSKQNLTLDGVNNADLSQADCTEQDKSGDLKGKEALEILCKTAAILKEGGNTALQAGNVHLAANRYDKAIQYCAVAFMDYPFEKLCFRHKAVFQRNSWTPILKDLITSRLNLSMCLLRPEIAKPQRAVDQAQLALKELKRFATKKGVVLNGKEEEVINNEPESTYNEAMELQAKAYFRLGSAQYDLGDYSASCRSFEHSAKITKALSKTAQPDKLIMRRLAEAKRENARQSKRQKKMFKFMFSGQDADETEANGNQVAAASTTADHNEVLPSGEDGHVSRSCNEGHSSPLREDEDDHAAPLWEDGKASRSCEDGQESRLAEESQKEAGTSVDEEMASCVEMASSNEMVCSNVAANSSEAANNEKAHSNDE